MQKIEDQLVKKLSSKLQYKFEKIYCLRKPSASPKLKKYLKNKLGYIPILQPEIDMIIRDFSGNLYAIEVKLFKADQINYKIPFYNGLGQAIALYRYGFDSVALFFFFLDSNSYTNMNRYGAEIWSFIRNDLGLPLDFSYFDVRKIENNFKFRVMQYTERQSGIKLLEIDDPKFLIKFKYSNPIRHLPLQIEIRHGLELWLNNKL